MNIYHYDHTTGEYLGVSAADESPLEPGVYLIPSYATADAPPATGLNQAAVYRGVAWVVVPDYRGAKYWLPDGSEHAISELGVSPPGGCLDAPPPPTKDQVIIGIVSAVQITLDRFARLRGYDGILSACTYATSTVQKFAAEGQYCVSARDAAWSKCYEILAAVDAGTRPVPTPEEVLSEMPALNWPAQ